MVPDHVFPAVGFMPLKILIPMMDGLPVRDWRFYHPLGVSPKKHRWVFSAK